MFGNLGRSTRAARARLDDVKPRKDSQELVERGNVERRRRHKRAVVPSVEHDMPWRGRRRDEGASRDLVLLAEGEADA